MRFEFATATRIIFGPGTLKEIGPIAAEMGNRALVVTGSVPDRAQPLLDDLAAQGVETTVFPISGEPTTHLVAEGTEKARQTNCDVVIGIGGGSTIDAGKAIAALLTNGGEPLDYLEGSHSPIHQPPTSPYPPRRAPAPR